MSIPRLVSCLLALPFLAAHAGAQEVLYATSGPLNPQLLTVDPATGGVLSALAISGEEALFGGLTDIGTTLWSIDGFNDPNSDRVFYFGAATGTGFVLGDTGFNWNFRCVEYHPLSNVLYAARDNELYTIDLTTGAATSVAPITGASLDQLTCIAIASNGAAYGLDIGGTGLFQLDLASGAATHLGDLGLPVFAQDLAFDSANRLWAVLATGGVYTIDVGAATASFEWSSGAWGGLTFSGQDDAGTPVCFGDGGGNPCGCGNESAPGAGGGCLNGLGVPAVLSATGVADTTADSLSLACAGVRSQPGLFFQGDNVVAGGSGLPFGDGLRCCGGNVVRLQVVAPAPPEPATALMTEAVTANGPAGTVQPGDTKCYQYWYRDPGISPCGGGFNLSNALSVTWM